MKIVGVIPARYKSSRFPGKPLADIFGKTMLQRVYEQVCKVKEFDEVYVAIDDDIIKEYCDTHNIPYIMTSDSHPTHVHRIHEVSEKVNSDFYVVVCGDEPLIEPDVIRAALPKEDDLKKEFHVQCLCRYFTDPAEVIDPANIKVVTNNNDECILLSRAPVPFPYKTIQFKYKKVVGVECYNKAALDFFISKEKGFLESVEDVTLQRFLENKININYKLIESKSLSVDTPRDLEKIKDIISREENID